MTDRRDDTRSDPDSGGDASGDDAFARVLARRLGREADAVPADVALRLQAMRREAAGMADAAPRRPRLPLLGSVVAATAAVALVVGVGLTRPDDEVLPLPATSDAELWAAENIDLLEDLEFLAWLDEDEPGAG